MNEVELRLTDITRYEDVERGRLVLTVGERQKSWKATWQTDLHISLTVDRSMPRGDLPLNLRKSRAPWPICPKVKLNRLTGMWILPLNTVRWSDFGVNLYLCSENDYLEPLARGDYKLFVDALLHYGVDTLTVEAPQCVKDENAYQHGFEYEFWK